MEEKDNISRYLVEVKGIYIAQDDVPSIRSIKGLCDSFKKLKGLDADIVKMSDERWQTSHVIGEVYSLFDVKDETGVDVKFDPTVPQDEYWVGVEMCTHRPLC